MSVTPTRRNRGEAISAAMLSRPPLPEPITEADKGTWAFTACSFPTWPSGAVVLTGHVARVRDAVLAGVRGDAAARVDDGDLAHRGERVGGQQLAERLLGADVVGEPVERVRPVGGLDDGLGGHGADPGARPRAQRTDAEPVRLHGHAELAGRRVEGHD